MYYNFRSWTDMGQETNLNLHLCFFSTLFNWNSWLPPREAHLAQPHVLLTFLAEGWGWEGRLHLEQRKDQQATEPSSQQNSDYYASELKNATFRSLEDLLGVHEISLKSSDLALTDNVGLNRGNSIKSELKYMFRDTILWTLKHIQQLRWRTNSFN